MKNPHVAAMVSSVVLLAGCGELVGESTAVETMQKAGFKNVCVTGKHGIIPVLFGCRKSVVAFNVDAVDPAGQRVSAVVCCDLIFKNCTIHY